MTAVDEFHKYDTMFTVVVFTMQFFVVVYTIKNKNKYEDLLE